MLKVILNDLTIQNAKKCSEIVCAHDLTLQRSLRKTHTEKELVEEVYNVDILSIGIQCPKLFHHKLFLLCVDASYVDPLGPQMDRPKTGVKKRVEDDDFADEELGDDLLPEQLRQHKAISVCKSRAQSFTTGLLNSCSADVYVHLLVTHDGPEALSH